jgi:hypothetical protein
MNQSSPSLNNPFSRGHFLHQASLGLEGALWGLPALARALSLPDEGFPDTSAATREALQSGKKLGVALVGLGKYSEGELAPALEETKLCRLAGIVTGTPEKAGKVAE